jgi:Nif-specific ferredoxin III
MSDNLTGLTLGGGEWVPQFVIGLDAGKCIGCGRCYKICARDVLELVERESLGLDNDFNGGDDDPFGDDDDDDDIDDDNAMVMLIKNRLDCIGCQACSRICSKNCFTHGPSPVTAQNAA